MITKTKNYYAEKSIPRRAIRTSEVLHVRSVDNLMGHLWQSASTMAFSLIVSTVLILFWMFGPEVSERMEAFTAFLFVLCGALFLGGLLAFFTPLIDMLTFSKLESFQRSIDECEELELKQQVKMVIHEAFRSDDPRTYVEEHSDLMHKFFGETIAGKSHR